MRKLRKMSSHSFAKLVAFASPFILIAIFLFHELRSKGQPRGAQSVLKYVYGDVRVLALQLVIFNHGSNALPEAFSGKSARRRVERFVRLHMARNGGIAFSNSIYLMRYNPSTREYSR